METSSQDSNKSRSSKEETTTKHADRARSHQPWDRDNRCENKYTGSGQKSTDSEKADRADARANNVILEAEKYKAHISAPTGNEINEIGNIAIACENNDDFFHVTCHVDVSLKEKIERGEFVDLERLLPHNTFRTNDESRLEIVNKNGMTYFAPVQDRNIKILGIRKWEQAFRVYAAIYSKANPHRASEIWQYIYVINLAASSYSWENVAFYDNMFRQLMSIKPNRSWSKTYIQGCNLAMTEPIARTQSSVQNRQSGGQNHHDWHDDCCWKYNKNKCNRNDCAWDHRCTYCGGWNHSFYNCRKRQKRRDRRSSPHDRNSSKGPHKHGSSPRRSTPSKKGRN